MSREPAVLAAIRESRDRIEKLLNDRIVEERTLNDLVVTAMRDNVPSDDVRMALGLAPQGDDDGE